MSLKPLTKYFSILVFSLLINSFYSFSVLGMEGEENISRKDPAFFRLTTQDNREIYILGCPHHVPIQKLVNSAALAEIERISLLNAIFYSEHENTNRVALQLLKEEENLIPMDHFELGVNLLSEAELRLSTEEQEILSREELMLNSETLSGLPLTQLLRARLWLGAVTLGTHAAILTYNRFGGTEHSLLNGNLRDNWSEINYLETPEEAIQILKENKESASDVNENMKWIKRSIEKIISIKTKSQSEMERLIKDQQNTSIENYSWNAINFNPKSYTGKYLIPISCFERNQLWTSVIQQKLEADQNSTPLFIVVGNGHLVGYPQGMSFISYLKNRINVKKIERFNLDGEWKRLI